MSWLSKALHKPLKTIAGAAIGFAVGGPVGAIAGGLIGAKNTKAGGGAQQANYQPYPYQQAQGNPYYASSYPQGPSIFEGCHHSPHHTGHHHHHHSHKHHGGSFSYYG